MAGSGTLTTRLMKNEMITSIIILMLFSFAYFSIFGSYIFTYQEKQVLFIFTSDYLKEFLNRPGGLLVYSGNFFTQFFFNPLAGSLILTIHIALLAVVCYIIAVRTTGKNVFTIPVSFVLPCIAVLLQSDYNIPFYYIQGFLLTCISYLLLMRASKMSYLVLSLAGFPFLYYLSGAFAWIFVFIFILQNLLQRRFPMAMLMILIAMITFYISESAIFYQTSKVLLTYPLQPYGRSVYILYLSLAFLAFFPLILKMLRSEIFLKAEVSISPYLSLVVFSICVFVLSRFFNPEVQHLFRLEKLIQDEKWDEAIRYQEKIQSKNIVAQYYYNLALSETDQLCDRLFSSRQDFGPSTLLVQWDSRVNINQIFRGAYFFYSIGLMNEAHRWAFESMVMQGYRPENIKLLIKTELIRGNFKVAAKYIDVLKRTFHYRNAARKYERMIDKPELVLADKELGSKVRFQPESDFLIRIKDQQANVPLLLQSCPSNKRAFEYMMAWYMLGKNLKIIASEAGRLKSLGYAKIPVHIEEALLREAELEGHSSLVNPGISPATIQRYDLYRRSISVSRDNRAAQKSFGKTLWYYLDFK